jgi:cytochrome c oxidase cbb3-type subunit 1
MRGNWGRFFSNISLRFTVLGAIAYIIVSFQGSQTALFGMNSLVHFTQYIPGHSHLGLLFFSGSIVVGGVYYALPRILNCELYGRRLASVQWVLYVVGFTLFFIGFTLAGIVQGSAWVKQGLPVWEVLPGIRAYMAMRILGGGLMFASFLMMPVIVIGTLVKRAPNTEPHYSFGRQRMPASDAGKSPEVEPS